METSHTLVPAKDLSALSATLLSEARARRTGVRKGRIFQRSPPSKILDVTHTISTVYNSRRGLGYATVFHPQQVELQLQSAQEQDVVH